MKVICPCGEEFETTQARIDQGRGKFCSRPCLYRYRAPRPTGLTYNITKPNPTAFRPGQTPWNAGTAGQGLQTAWNKGLPGRSGEDHPQWQGDDLTYFALHQWVARNKQRTGVCGRCGRRGRTHFANLSHEYRRDLDDYEEMCQSCAHRYDRESGHWGTSAEDYERSRKCV